ncbi:hypothetical protein KC19_8G154100 [Ceratodon purpureus]|uniref:Uncharacterized protein n=1 Tax=Ceratodon purpureus TaxID=3225 RepID=A0A8T0H1H6_CERPU|nr:hypothetical protein KC19_8G154100 [Ceratodon purpureus]
MCTMHKRIASLRGICKDCGTKLSLRVQGSKKTCYVVQATRKVYCLEENQVAGFRQAVYGTNRRPE